MNNSMMYVFPARIKKYYPETQTADITISAERVYSNMDGNEKIRDYSVILDVPVQTVSGGNFAITFPIKEGDTCKISFSQVGYDHWFVNDKDRAGKLFGIPHPHLRRTFNADDGFCEVGYNTLPRTFKNVSPDNVVLRNKEVSTFITVREDGSIELNNKGSKISIESDLSVTIDAPTINIFGNINHTGDLVHEGNVLHTGDMIHEGEITRTSSENEFPPTNNGTVKTTTIPPQP